MKYLQRVLFVFIIIIISSCAQKPISSSTQELSKNIIRATQLAEQGDAFSQLELGFEYANQQNYKEALKWYKLAAEQGDPTAADIIGQMYLNGRGVTKNYQEALMWFQKSVELGNIHSQANIGSMYEFGLGVKQDYKEAYNYYKKLAKRGSMVAQDKLGDMYSNGKGVPRNYIKSYIWYILIEYNGSKVEDVLRKIKKLETKMSAADIEKAKTLAKQCLDSNYQNCD